MLRCPHCQGTVRFDVTLANRDCTCPHCEGLFVMPPNHIEMRRQKKRPTTTPTFAWVTGAAACGALGMGAVSTALAVARFGVRGEIMQAIVIACALAGIFLGAAIGATAGWVGARVSQ